MRSRRRPALPPAIVAVLLLPPPLVQAAWLADPTLRQGPLVVIDESDKVLAADIEAAAVGVQPGQRLAQARIACPELRTAPPDDLAATVLYEDLLHMLGTLSPIIEPADPARGLVYLDARGLERLIGDLAAVAAAAWTTASAENLAVRVGAGSRRLIALSLAPRMPTGGPPPALDAEEGDAFLRGLPVADPVLAVEDEDQVQLYDVGLRRVGDLAALPRGSLSLRTGPAVLALWDALHGVSEPPLVPFQVPPRITVADRFEGTSDRLLLDRLLGRLCARLAEQLQARQQAARVLTLRAGCENGAVHVQRLERWPALARELELTTAASLLDAVCARLQSTHAALSAFALTADGLVAAPGEQPALWGDPQGARQKRLSAVLQAQAQRHGNTAFHHWQADPLADDGWREEDGIA
jgi:nucleotidyltransferase/DNA polymerase involved in DNA repair